jgi:hypothetical protein
MGWTHNLDEQKARQTFVLSAGLQVGPGRGLQRQVGMSLSPQPGTEAHEQQTEKHPKLKPILTSHKPGILKEGWLCPARESRKQ